MLRPSQKEIAKRLGISVASVSLALRRKGTVSKELTERVHAVAAEIGYQPNPLLSSLASKQFRSAAAIQGTPIAVLDFLIEGVGSTEYLDCIKTFGKELGYQITHYHAKDLARYQDPSATLYARGVQGLIILGLVEDDPVIHKLEWNRFSIVQCGRFLISLPFHTARPDIFRGIKESFLRVKSLGYKRIGFAPAHHHPIVEDDEARISAAYGMINLHIDAPDRIPPHAGGLHDNESFLAWVRRWEPDVVIGFNHWFCEALHSAGYDIPGDIGYASLHVSPGVPVLYSHPKRLRLSGIDQNIADIAHECVVLLDQSIHYHSLGIPRVATNVLIPPTWRDGDTLRQQVSATKPKRQKRKTPRARTSSKSHAQ